MADIKSPEERSRNMAAIKSKDTKPEIFLRHLLFQRGYRYRLNVKDVPGHPDLFLRKYNTAIFVHGCFWHRHSGCKYAYMPKSRIEFWEEKFKRNIQRDRIVREEIAEQNIKMLIIWECTIKHMKDNEKYLENVVEIISAFLLSEVEYLEL